MLAEAIQKILDLAHNDEHLINGLTYTDKPVTLVPRHFDKPEAFQMSGLDGIARVINTELDEHASPVVIRVTDPTTVDVFSTYLPDMSRYKAYVAKAEVPSFHDGYVDHNEAIIRLRSRFAPNDGQEYLLNLLRTMNMEQSAQSDDNGVTQTITARQGIALNQTVTVKPIVKLRPYRTFHEVDQPESEFLLRIDNSGRVGLFEADGGAWKLQAKKNIADYFCNHPDLKAHLDTGDVIVTI